MGELQWQRRSWRSCLVNSTTYGLCLGMGARTSPTTEYAKSTSYNTS